MSEIVSFKRAVFTETGEERRIERDCKVCLARLIGFGVGVISPTGFVHVTGDGGVTLCGKDATGDGWWWPE